MKLAILYKIQIYFYNRLNFLNQNQFHIIAQVQFEDGVTETWLKSQADYHSPWVERYVVSLYWSVITIITIGYGDITPKTMIERIYVILFTFIGCGLFAYSINVIGEQVREIGRDKSIFKRKSAKLSKFMSHRGLNKDLQQKVRKYYEYLFYEQMNEEEEGANVFNNLTTLLKKQVWIDAYGKLLKSKPIFMANFSDEFINMLSLKVKEKKFGPEEYIFVNGDFSNYIFIIISGEVDQKGDMFGQLEFFSQQKRTSTIKTKCVTSVAYLNYSDFLIALQQYENDREIYYQIKDQINLYKNYSNIDLKCPICYEYGRHSTHECNSVNFVMYKEKLIINAKTCNSQERQNRNIIVQENLKLQKTMKNTKDAIGSLKHIPNQYKMRSIKYNAIVNNKFVKESGFCIIVDALAEQIQETLSRDEDSSMQQRITSGEIKEVQSDEDIEENQQQQISVSEDENGNNDSENNKDLQVKNNQINKNKNQNDYMRQFRMKTKSISYLKNNSNIISENKIHVEVSAEQEESQWNMPNTQRSQKKTLSQKFSPKNSIFNQDSDRKIEICKSQEYIDYTYAIKNDINLYLIPYAYVIDQQFKFPQEVILSVCGNIPKNFQFIGSPTKFQNPISASSQYNKQISQKSDLLVSQNTSNSSLSPTIFQMHQNVQNSNRYIEPQRVANNLIYQNNNTQNFIQLSPTANNMNNRINNFSNHPILNNPLNNNQTLYGQSPRNQQNYLNPQIQLNSQNQINPLSQFNIQNQIILGNTNSFGAALNSINNQQNSSDYNNMITQNPFAPQYSHSSSPYHNRLGTYGIYLPALQQLEPINELQSKEIVSSDDSQEGEDDKLSSRRSNLGSKKSQPKRRRSKEPSINLHMKSYIKKDSVLSNPQGNNSQHIDSNLSITANHMEPFSPQKIPQISHETIPIQGEQDTTFHDENYLAIMSARIRKATEQHVQFAEEEDLTSNKSGNTLQVQYGQSNQNTLNSLNILNNQNFYANQNIQNNQNTPKNQKNNYNILNNQIILNNQGTPKNNQNTYWNAQYNQNTNNNQNTYNNSNAIIKQNTLNNQNTMQKQNTLASFEQSQQNPNGTIKNKRSSLKPSIFSNNQLNYMNSMSLTNGNQTTRLPSSQNQSDLSNNVIYQKMSTSPYNQAPTTLYTNLNQGSGTQLVANQNTTQLKSMNGFSRSISYGFDPSSLYSKLMSRQSVQFKFKKDQDYCALIYKKHVNLKAIDKVYEDIYNNFDVMKNYSIYFWHNNFSQISIKDNQKFIRRKFHSTATTIKQRKASRTNDTYIKNSHRTSVLFHFSRNNSNAFHHQSSLHMQKRNSIASLNHIKHFQDKNQKQLTTQKTLQI